jgi:hypothetical protein
MDKTRAQRWKSHILLLLLLKRVLLLLRLRLLLPPPPLHLLRRRRRRRRRQQLFPILLWPRPVLWSLLRPTCCASTSWFI